MKHKPERRRLSFVQALVAQEFVYVDLVKKQIQARTLNVAARRLGAAHADLVDRFAHCRRESLAQCLRHCSNRPTCVRQSHRYSSSRTEEVPTGPAPRYVRRL